MHVRCHIAAEHGTREEAQAYEPQKPRIMERHEGDAGNEPEIIDADDLARRDHQEDDL
jgi:hypothetical protein